MLFVVNTNLIIYKDTDTKLNERKRKRPWDSGIESMDECVQDKQKNPTLPMHPKIVEIKNEVLMGSKVKTNGGTYRAGYNAFMIGFSYITFMVHNVLIQPEESHKSEAVSRLLGVPIKPEFSDLNINNRIFLVCKDMPFLIRKSSIARNSIAHSEKYSTISLD